MFYVGQLLIFKAIVIYLCLYACFLSHHDFISIIVLLQQQFSYSGTLGYTNPEMEVQDPTAMGSQEGTA